MNSASPLLLAELVTSFRRPFRSRRSVERYQTSALRALLEHAGNRVPFYRRRLESVGLRPEHFSTLSDLRRFPPVSRQELQEAALADRMAAGVALAACRSYETSGSCGQPLRIVRTPREDARLFGRRLRAQMLSGLRPWHLRVNVGSPRRLFPWHRIGFRIRTVSNREERSTILSELTALAPDVLMVSPESLAMLLDQVTTDHLPQPRHLFSGANQLTPSLRRRAEAMLGATVTDFYGTAECNLVAWECRRCGHYHTSDDSVIVEVVREDGGATAPGEEGEVLLTALHSFAMPFIRLRIGDLACRPTRPVDCVVRFGAIDRIRGRAVDYLRFPGGRLIGPFPILDAVDDLSGLGRWQLVQHQENRVEVHFEPLRGTAADTLGEAIAARLRALLPGDVSIDVNARTMLGEDEAEAAPGGHKHRFVRSLLG